MRQKAKYREDVRKIAMSMAALVATGMLIFACSSDDESKNTNDSGSAVNEAGTGGTIKVGFIYIGPPGDLGWTYAHDQGRKALEATLSNVETIYEENVKETTDDVVAAVDKLVAKGAKIIFTASFGFMDGTEAAAKKYPNVWFEHCSGYKRLTNLSTYFGRMEQARYLAGMVAGSMTKTNMLCANGAFPIPEVIRLVNAFVLGAQSVNPDVQMKVKWLGSWYFPEQEAKDAEELIKADTTTNTKCDVILQNSDSTASLLKAADEKVYAIGYHSDVAKFAAEAVLTSSVWNWGPYYTERVKALQDGTYKGDSDKYEGLKEGVVKLTTINSVVDQAIIDKVKAKEEEIKSGTFDPFQGPITRVDENGQDVEWVKAGEKLTDAQILGDEMKYFVKGVVELNAAPGKTCSDALTCPTNYSCDEVVDETTKQTVKQCVAK